jgi:hypothetical protein
MKRVLNDNDMRDMVLELAESVVVGREDDATGGIMAVVRDVRVDAVGPAGIVLMARLSNGDGSYYDDDSGGMNNEKLMDVPIRFEMVKSLSGGEGGGGTSIRRRVLALFSY